MYTPASNKSAAATASLAIVVAIAYGLVVGLRSGWSAKLVTDLVSVDIRPVPSSSPTPPPPPPMKVHASTSAAKGAPAPRNLRNKATQVVAPKVPPLIVPPPIVAATQAGVGSASNNGASDRVGPGQGAGGIGNGFGGGGNGGDGEGEGAVAGPRQIRGDLSYRDLPQGVLPEGAEATVDVIFWIEANGSVTQCRTERSSGYRELDALACRLIEQRYRFRPALTADHRPVRVQMTESHTWVAHDRSDDR